MSKYNIGDVVRVRNNLELNTDYFMDDGTNYNRINKDMIEFCGKLVHIYKIDLYDGQYFIQEDARWRWTDEMFEDAILPAEVFDKSDYDPVIETKDTFIEDLVKLYKV